MSRFSRPCSRCGARMVEGVCPACSTVPRRSSCAECGAPTDGARYCAAHEHLAGEAGRLARQPYRHTYSDPEYRRGRAAALHRAGGTCERCGRSAAHLQVDHIVPLRDGGSNARDNLQALCWACHQEKSRSDKRKRKAVRYE